VAALRGKPTDPLPESTGADDATANSFLAGKAL
jgi:hypothetical protein